MYVFDTNGRYNYEAIGKRLLMLDQNNLFKKIIIMIIVIFNPHFNYFINRTLTNEKPRSSVLNGFLPH